MPLHSGVFVAELWAPLIGVDNTAKVMRKDKTAQASAGSGLSHTEVCAVSEFTPVNRERMDFLLYSSECSPEWYLALMSPKPIFLYAQESTWNDQILLMKVIIKTGKGYKNKKVILWTVDMKICLQYR